MRSPRTTALLALGVALAVAPARAQDAREPFTLSIEPPPEVRVGDRGEIAALVVLGPGAARPMLVTPSSEGPAIEIVRGRFTRADAHDPEEEILRFEIPFVARTAGTSVVRVRIDGFACGAERCSAVQLEESVAMEVRAR